MGILGKQVNDTGIKGLDEVLQEGIPEGHVVLLEGSAGSGKTVLSMQWLFEGYKEQNSPGVYIAVTEAFTKAIQNISSMDFYSQDLLSSGDLHFTDLRSMEDLIGFDNNGLEEIDRDEIEKLVGKIEKVVKDADAERLVIDSITALGYRIDDKELFRHFIFRLGTIMSSLNCTVFLTSEARNGSSPFNVEDFISDGIITLDHTPGEQSMVRFLNVKKMRGIDYRSGSVNFEISSEGISVYPKVPVPNKIAKTDFKTRKETGVKKLDEMIDGGYPRGHVILLTGNTGTGKSTFGMQFLFDGLENGEHSLFVNLEEPLKQVKKTAESHGWDLDSYVEEGLLEFLTPNLIDTYPDKFLYQVENIIEESNIERMVLDSVSSLTSSDMEKDELREVLLQLNSMLKKNGVTCIMTHLASGIFSAGSEDLLGNTQASNLRLSSLTDGIILLRYVERENSVKKALNVLKMRGSKHSKEIREFEIKQDGIRIGNKFRGK